MESSYLWCREAKNTFFNVRVYNNIINLYWDLFRPSRYLNSSVSQQNKKFQIRKFCMLFNFFDHNRHINFCRLLCNKTTNFFVKNLNNIYFRITTTVKSWFGYTLFSTPTCVLIPNSKIRTRVGVLQVYNQTIT